MIGEDEAIRLIRLGRKTGFELWQVGEFLAAKKEEVAGEWVVWLAQRRIGRTTAWEAIKLHTEVMRISSETGTTPEVLLLESDSTWIKRHLSIIGWRKNRAAPPVEEPYVNRVLDVVSQKPETPPDKPVPMREGVRIKRRKS